MVELTSQLVMSEIMQLRSEMVQLRTKMVQLRSDGGVEVSAGDGEVRDRAVKVRWWS